MFTPTCYSVVPLNIVNIFWYFLIIKQNIHIRIQFVSEKHFFRYTKYYRVIALISSSIVPSWDIEGRELASVRRYPNEGHYSPISVR